MSVKFSVLFNTATDWVKAAAAAVAAGGTAYAVAAQDGSVSLGDWLTVGGGTVAALVAALGLYHSKDASTVSTPGKVATEISTADPQAQTVEYTPPVVLPNVSSDIQPGVPVEIPPIA